MGHAKCRTQWGWCTFFLLLITVVFGVSAGYSQEPPPLPQGLGGDEKEDPLPALPAGLGASAEQPPALPTGLDGTEEKDSKEAGGSTRVLPRLQLHGFFDARTGVRMQHDPAYSRTGILGEGRLQLETSKVWERGELSVVADFIGDGVMEEADLDIRRLRLTWALGSQVDVWVGRQVLTWGTGDMLFINDLFPKDWQSFFIGRDVEYLKAPSDAVKVGWYGDALNAEVVYTPQFEPDRFIRGERVSYWNPLWLRRDGHERPLHFNAPSNWFSDDELALRVYRTVGRYTVAVYGYMGYWKSPGGQRLTPSVQAVFPRLNVYGASLRGALGKGIVNAEIGYYDSRDDRDGRDMFVNNSEFRVLLGYEREVGHELTAAVQYYLEHMLDYDAYTNRQFFWVTRRDKDRHVFTLRLTKLLMDQNLTLSFFGYYSPTDGDTYLRPNLQYKINDAWRVETGANVFWGESESTFFGQFDKNTNVYIGARYSF